MVCEGGVVGAVPADDGDDHVVEGEVGEGAHPAREHLPAQHPERPHVALRRKDAV